ncbi:MAG: hypothetical protein IJ179_03205 [Oscillospiraceae bacterium]|nr:hypothetical protein [Oscillospiraceae bacterium]
MKQLKKILVIVLALAMVLSLSACGAFETKMAKAAQKMSKVESLRMDMDMDMDMSISVMGESLGIDANVEAEMDVLTKPVKIAGSMAMDMMDEEIEFLFYVEQTDDGYTLYLSPDNGESWVRRDVEGVEAPEVSKTEQLGMLAKLAETFEEQGTEEIRGSAATVYKGVISGADISAAITESGALEQMEELQESTEIDLSGLDFSDLSDIPTTIAIDNKSGMISRYTMDMTDIMQDFMESIMNVVLAQVAKESGMEGVDLAALGLTVEIDKVEATVDLFDYDAVKTVEIPQDALEAEAA